MLDLLKKYGIPGWITPSDHFAEFLDLAYGAYFRGEVWLYNNDLQVISDPNSFEELYVRGIFGKHFGKVDAVKILVSPSYQDQVFSSNGLIPSPSLSERFLRLHDETSGDEKLRSILFGKLTDNKKLNLPSNYSIAFYVHGNSLLKNNPSGIVMIRPHIYPFFQEQKSSQYAIVWQLVDQTDIMNDRLDCFNDFFSSTSDVRYSHVVVKGGKPALMPCKPSTNSTSGREGLLLGQETDYLILASNHEELEALETAFSDTCKQPLSPTPIRGDEFRLAVVRQHRDLIRIVFGVTGEGNTCTAIKTWEAIMLWRPRQVVYVGMAGGDPDDDNLKVGDLVVGEEIIRYENATVRDRGRSRTEWAYKIKPHRWPASQLKDKAQKLSLKWKPVGLKHANPTLGRNENEIQVLIQPIGSGNKLVLSPAYFRMLKDGVNSKLKAIEMEGDGAGEACHAALPPVKLLIVRGIMDKCNHKSRGNESSRRSVRRAVSEIIAQFVTDLLLGNHKALANPKNE